MLHNFGKVHGNTRARQLTERPLCNDIQKIDVFPPKARTASLGAKSREIRTEDFFPDEEKERYQIDNVRNETDL